jgi:hypothetical protein
MSDCELEYFTDSDPESDDVLDEPLVLEFWEQNVNVNLWEILRADAPLTKEGMIAKMLNIFQINDILEVSAKNIPTTITCMDNWFWAKDIIKWKFGNIRRMDAVIDCFIELLSKQKPFGLITFKEYNRKLNYGIK